ncbi:hypothetical protein WDX82_004807 [Salmonella enterica]
MSQPNNMHGDKSPAPARDFTIEDLPEMVIVSLPGGSDYDPEVFKALVKTAFRLEPEHIVIGTCKGGNDDEHE